MSTKQQETFIVRTSNCPLSQSGIVWQTTIAQGRPEAVRQLERIGAIHPGDREDVRSFLEGGMTRLGAAMFVFSEDRKNGGRSAMVFKVDE